MVDSSPGVSSWDGSVGRARAFLGRARVRRRFEQADQRADGVVTMLWMAERQLFVHLVHVAASIAGLREVPGSHQIVDDLGHSSLGDADGAGDVSQTSRTVATLAMQDLVHSVGG